MSDLVRTAGAGSTAAADGSTVRDPSADSPPNRHNGSEAEMAEHAMGVGR